MSTAGRLQDAMHEALHGYESGDGTFTPGPCADLDRGVESEIIDAAVEVAWRFIEAERRAGNPGEDNR